MKLRDIVEAKLEKLTENKGHHRVSVTVSDPAHPMVAKRQEQVCKTCRVSSDSDHHAMANWAIDKAKAHYKKRGYKVHGAEHIGFFSEAFQQPEQQDDQDQAQPQQAKPDPKAYQLVKKPPMKAKRASKTPLDSGKVPTLGDDK